MKKANQAGPEGKPCENPQGFLPSVLQSNQDGLPKTRHVGRERRAQRPFLISHRMAQVVGNIVRQQVIALENSTPPRQPG